MFVEFFSKFVCLSCFSSFCSRLLLSETLTYFRIISSNSIEIGIIVKNVIFHPNSWIIKPPTDNPMTEPAANIEVMIPVVMEILSLGNWSRIMLNAIGNIPSPMPWIVLAIIIVRKSFANPPKQTPTV